MALAASTRLGAYEILSPLGVGGMGEVYRARDSKLAREVAIKVLPTEVSADPNRLVRFEQEARSASALNHPNIVTIYEIGSLNSVLYIAMELVQGRTLRELLTDGPLPTKRLLALSAQIADGLARAHDAGIVHRDLKPENVMITREGLVKILDFGLAKLTGPSPEMSQLPTIAGPTEPGMVLGTIGYMSPEQAMGRPVDFRSDQFSLGSILYEMATGKRAFSRGSAPETMAAIIREEPEPLSGLGPPLPVALRWIIERCLAKDPHDRYASTRDLARDLVQLRDHVSEITAAGVPAPIRRRPGWLAVAWVSSVLLVAALAFFVGLRARQEPARSPLRFIVSLPAGATQVRVSISPDGTRLGMETFSKGQRRLYVRPLDADEPIELPGTSGATAHFWSPDSRHLAFWADGKLKKVSIAGGPPVDLCEAVVSSTGAWSRTGTILFPNRVDPSPAGDSARSAATGLFRVSESGGEVQRVTTVGPEEDNHKGPSFLPDGRRFLYHVNTMPGVGKPRELRLGSLDSKQTRLVTRLDSRAEYSPLGYVVYAREGALFAQRFDEKRARLMGEPFLLADDVSYVLSAAEAGFSISQTNVLVYRNAASSQRMAWVNRGGKETAPLGESLLSGSFPAFRISPDGRRVAVAIRDKSAGTSDIWMFESGSGVSTRLHSDPGISEIVPVWTSDGSKLLYASDRPGPPDIYEMPLGESGGLEKLLVEQFGYQQPEDVSRDGRLLLFTSAWPNRDIWLVPLDGKGQPSPWARSRFTESSPRFSPDGRWIAYESDESGDPEIYLAQTQGGGGKQRISATGGRQPRWRADGRELYYIGPGDLIMAVPVTPGPRMDAGAPVTLFRAQGVANYDVTADGSRFLVGIPTNPDRESQVHVIVNWTAALRREQ